VTDEVTASVSDRSITQAIIFGAGGHARVIASLVKGPVTLVDQIAEDSFLTSPDILRQSRVYLGIGNDRSRRRVFDRLTGLCITPSVCIAPMTFVQGTLGSGTVVCPGSIIMTGTTVGVGVIINTMTSIDHDCVVGDHSQLCPGVTLAGRVTIGEMVFIGTRSAVLPGVKIGSGAKVRAGSVVWKHVEANTLVGGNPAVFVRRL
jgi:sugar O-acyltransferase (sialic acid O-acetyltransferase NeuD family)